MEENIQPQETQQHLFEDHIEYKEATQGTRFLNFLIDNIFIRFALSYATGTALGYILAYTSPDFLYWIAEEGESSVPFYLLALTITYLNYIIYYTICEAAFKGYTLGKIITGSKAIREDGKPLTFKDALLRSLSRIVPFEAFSGFGRPWHDSWTRTTVVKAR